MSVRHVPACMRMYEPKRGGGTVEPYIPRSGRGVNSTYAEIATQRNEAKNKPVPNGRKFGKKRESKTRRPTGNRKEKRGEETLKVAGSWEWGVRRDLAA